MAVGRMDFMLHVCLLIRRRQLSVENEGSRQKETAESWRKERGKQVLPGKMVG